METKEKVRASQQLHGTRKGIERQPATIGDYERHAATKVESHRHATMLWYLRDSQRQPYNIGDSERLVVTP